MPKGKVRKVSKKRVSKKRGKRISHKKKVIKGGNPQTEPYRVDDKILYFINGEVRYGIINEITEINEKTNKYIVQHSKEIGVSQKPTDEITSEKIISSFDKNIFNYISDILNSNGLLII